LAAVPIQYSTLGWQAASTTWTPQLPILIACSQVPQFETLSHSASPRLSGTVMRFDVRLSSEAIEPPIEDALSGIGRIDAHKVVSIGIDLLDDADHCISVERIAGAGFVM